jgi:hypothetical protein
MGGTSSILEARIRFSISDRADFSSYISNASGLILVNNYLYAGFRKGSVGSDGKNAYGVMCNLKSAVIQEDYASHELGIRIRLVTHGQFVRVLWSEDALRFLHLQVHKLVQVSPFNRRSLSFGGLARQNSLYPIKSLLNLLDLSFRIHGINAESVRRTSSLRLGNSSSIAVMLILGDYTILASTAILCLRFTIGLIL